MNLKVTDKQHILSLSSIEKRAMTCLKFLNVEYKKILHDFQCKEGWDDSRGFDFYMRAMYSQKGGAHKTDYFMHSDRMKCEQHVLEEMGKC